MVTRKSRAAKQEHDLLFTSRLDEIRNVYRGTIARPHSAPKQPHRSMQLVIAAARSAGFSASIASRRLMISSSPSPMQWSHRKRGFPVRAGDCILPPLTVDVTADTLIVDVTVTP
jgi:hypothetical protein